MYQILTWSTWYCRRAAQKIWRPKKKETFAECQGTALGKGCLCRVPHSWHSAKSRGPPIKRATQLALFAECPPDPTLGKEIKKIKKNKNCLSSAGSRALGKLSHYDLERTRTHAHTRTHPPPPLRPPPRHRLAPARRRARRRRRLLRRVAAAAAAAEGPRREPHPHAPRGVAEPEPARRCHSRAGGLLPPLRHGVRRRVPRRRRRRIR